MQARVKTATSIDGLGNVLDRQGNPIGFIDEGQCYLLDGTIIPCPEQNRQTNTPTVVAKQSYWWLVIVVFILMLALGLYFYSSKKS